MLIFLDFLGKTYWGGAVCVLLGLFIIWHVRNYPQNYTNAKFAPDLKGWAAGIMLIVGGLAAIICKLFEI